MEYNFFYSHLISVPAISFFISVLFKGFFSYLNDGKFKLKKALSSGGMPSVHSAVVTALTTGVAFKYGVGSDLFAVCLGFTVIIIYDAINIRYEAGLHAIAINKILGEKFNEHLGHLPSEAFAGSMVGIFIALILFYI